MYVEMFLPLRLMDNLKKNVYEPFAFQYYFGDNNMPRDKFLQEKIKEDDGCILLCLFMVMRYHTSIMSYKK